VAAGGAVVFNEDIVRALGVPEEILHAAVCREQARLDEEERICRSGLPALAIAGRTVLLIDDGLATGATMRAAIRAVRARAREVVVAVPVAAASTCRALSGQADRVIAAATPHPFEAVGNFYLSFEPTTTEEVVALLAQARRNHRALPAASPAD
jgi:putative phosphoribosyl transferase